MFDGIRVLRIAYTLEAFKMSLRSERDVLFLPFEHKYFNWMSHPPNQPHLRPCQLESSKHATTTTNQKGTTLSYYPCTLQQAVSFLQVLRLLSPDMSPFLLRQRQRKSS